MIGILRSEDVVGDIGSYVTAIIAPLNVGGHTVDLGNGETLRELLACVHIALDVVFTSPPSPSAAPFDTRAGGALDGSALAARSGRVFAPEIVVELVAIATVVCVLGTQSCCL